MPAIPQNITQKLNFGGSSAKKIYILILILAVFSGSATGYVLASTKSNGGTAGGGLAPTTQGPATAAQQDNQTFKDFAEGTIQPKPSPKAGTPDYSAGAYLLIRANAVPVALTSSVVDLSQYSGKKVKVFGETQQDPNAGWLMDVGKVEVE